MKTHRFVYTTRFGRQWSETFEFRNDDMAAVCARSLLSKEVISVAVRRIELGGSFERVGLWIWNHGDPRWKPGE